MFCLYISDNKIIKSYNFLFDKNYNFNLINSRDLISSSLYKKMINTKNFKLDKFCKKFNIHFIFTINNNYYYSFNHLNRFYLNSLIKLMNKILTNNENILFFDNDYKTVLPIYNYFYGYKNIQKNKNFFLLKKKSITLNNWLYFYNFFILDLKVKCLIFLDYYEFSKFFKNFLRLNLPLISIVPHNVNSCYIDYYFYINYFDLNVNKIILYNFISSNIFYNNNFKNHNFKKNYIVLLFRLSKTFLSKRFF